MHHHVASNTAVPAPATAAHAQAGCSADRAGWHVIAAMHCRVALQSAAAALARAVATVAHLGLAPGRPAKETDRMPVGQHIAKAASISSGN
jgi:hypothetical protein